MPTVYRMPTDGSRRSQTLYSSVDGDAAARFDGKFAQGGRDEQECKEEGKLDCAVAELDDARAAREKVREREDLASRLAARARRGLKRAVSRINSQSRS